MVVQCIRWMLITLSVALAGCSGVKTVQTFDDSAAEAVNAATLEVPGNIDVISIDGTKMPDYLIEDLAVNYELLPGTHEIVVSYSTIWANPGAGEDRETAVQIDSHPLLVNFQAHAGAHYRLSVPEAGSLLDARQMQQSPRIALLDSAGRQLAMAGPAGMKKRENTRLLQRIADSIDKKVGSNDKVIVNNATTTNPIQGIDAASGQGGDNTPKLPITDAGDISAHSVGAADGEGVSRLEALKMMWKDTNKEDKKAFLKWAFQ